MKICHVFIMYCKKTIYHNEISHDTKKFNQPWFDDDCSNMRNIFHVNFNNYDKSDNNRSLLCQSRTAYKHIIQEKKLLYDEKYTAK